MIRDQLELWFASSDVTVVFQPIVHVNGSLSAFAIEALTRGPRGTQFESADVFFDYLRQTKQEIRADRHCIEVAIALFARTDASATLSVNIHPSTLERDGGFPEFLAATLAREQVDPRRIILEIIEESRYWSTQALAHAVRELRDEGVRIALDDVGVGRCNYRTIIDVAPDLLKVDRYFVHGSAGDGKRRAVLESVRHLAEDIGASVVAEGVEREDDFAVVCDIGIPYAQGFLFSRPRPLSDLAGQPEEPRKNTIKETRVCSEKKFCSSMTPTPS